MFRYPLFSFYGIVVSLLFVSPSLSGQNCQCDHILGVSDTYVNANDLDIKAGDVICIAGGQRSNLALMNFHGSSGNPVVFTNCSGQVVIENYYLGYGLKFSNCTNFLISGTGDPAYRYGIKVAGTTQGAPGLQIGDLSSDFEIENVEVTRAGFAGIMAKTDPGCDGTSNRGNFYMKNIKIHDNYIHDVHGEGMYIGNSFYSGKNSTCGGQQVTLYPHDVTGLRVYDNVVGYSGWEGIQVGCGSEDVEIHDNMVTHFGEAGKSGQNNGIQIGEGTTGKVFNNIIKDGTGNGIIVLGIGDNLIFNNLIIRPGTHGVFCDNRITTAGSTVAFINNTIIEPAMGGILNYNEKTVNLYYNNLITGENSSIDFGQGATGLLKNNIVCADLSGPSDFNSYFTDIDNDDYQPASESPVIDSGMDVSSFGFDFDLNNNSRLVNGKYDIGAYEYQSANPENPQLPSGDDDFGGYSLVYRVNAGGLEEADLPINWNLDKQNNPSKYLTKESSNTTTGSNSWSGENNTHAPDNVFGNNRYTGPWGGALGWNFPAEKGIYIVLLYFAEKPGKVDDIGQRIFDIDIEGVKAFQDLDIFREAGMRALQKVYQVSVEDGFLNIDFQRKTGDPQVNGIEIYMQTDKPDISVTASSFQSPNYPSNTLDGDLSTRWSAIGPGEWILFDLNTVRNITSVDISFQHGDERNNFFDISISEDSTYWYQVYTGGSNGISSDYENFDFTDYPGQYVKITGRGNTQNLWNSYQELKINTLPIPAGSPAQDDSGTIIYRINAGGLEETDDAVNWAMDKQGSRSVYLSPESSNTTTGSNSWSGTNNTGAPDNIFGNNRYSGPWGGIMKWDFPVEDGLYTVNLYFAEKPGFIYDAGQRIFDVEMEGKTFIGDLDIFMENGLNAVRKSSLVSVVDGNLDIDFTRKTGDPQVNGIEIISIPGDVYARTVGNPQENKIHTGSISDPENHLNPMEGLRVYPNPFYREIKIDLSQVPGPDFRLELYNFNGKIVFIKEISGEDSIQEKILHINGLTLKTGIYFLRVSNAGYSKVIKLIK